MAGRRAGLGPGWEGKRGPGVISWSRPCPPTQTVIFMFEVFSALAPPAIVATAFLLGVRALLNHEKAARAEERRQALAERQAAAGQ